MRSFETAYKSTMSINYAIDPRQERRTLFEVTDVATSERDTNFVEFGGRHRASGVIFFFALSNVTHI
jgi:hypothetical protein